MYIIEGRIRVRNWERGFGETAKADLAYIPMKAISYFTSWLVRQGWYLIRPKVEMPENTESACLSISPVFRAINWKHEVAPEFHHHRARYYTTVPRAGPP